MYKHFLPGLDDYSCCMQPVVLRHICSPPCITSFNECPCEDIPQKRPCPPPPAAAKPEPPPSACIEMPYGRTIRVCCQLRLPPGATLRRVCVEVCDVQLIGMECCCGRVKVHLACRAEYLDCCGCPHTLCQSCCREIEWKLPTPPCIHIVGPPQVCCNNCRLQISTCLHLHE